MAHFLGGAKQIKPRSARPWDKEQIETYYFEKDLRYCPSHYHLVACTAGGMGPFFS